MIWSAGWADRLRDLLPNRRRRQVDARLAALEASVFRPGMFREASESIGLKLDQLYQSNDDPSGLPGQLLALDSVEGSTDHGVGELSIFVGGHGRSLVTDEGRNPTQQRTEIEP